MDLSLGNSISLSKDQSKEPLVLAESTTTKYDLEGDEHEAETFLTKVRELKLPQAPYHKKVKKGATKPTKSLIGQPKGPNKPRIELKVYLLENIDLSGFVNRGFSKMALQELLKGLENLVTIRKLLLNNNGIDDECSVELAEVVKNKKIQYLNLSCNKLGKMAGQAIGQALTSTSHFIWLEYVFMLTNSISTNEFSGELVVIKTIITALRNHVKLMHLGISLTEKSSETLFSTLFERGGLTEKSTNSLNLRDSLFSDRAFNSLAQILSAPKANAPELYHITGTMTNEYRNLL